MLVSNNFTGKLWKACETKHGPTCVAEPADIYRVEADEIFQVKQNGRQAVELVGKPEVREPNVVKRRRKNSKLQQWHSNCWAAYSGDEKGFVYCHVDNAVKCPITAYYIMSQMEIEWVSS